MPFSLAIFSADWPIVRPVDGSAMAGVCGARSFGRSFENALSLPPSVRAFDASTRAFAMRRLCRIGMSDRLSAPPAMPTAACPSRISSTTSAMASPADAHARLTVTTVSIQAGSASLRSTSSRTQARARSTAVRSR